MPFDGKSQDLSFASGREGLRRLAMMLLDQMPSGFTFDFDMLYFDQMDGCRGCALGLGMHCWPEMKRAVTGSIVNGTIGDCIPAIAKLFDVNRVVVEDIFFDAFNLYGKRRFEVTPADVAERIVAFLERGPEDFEKRVKTRIGGLFDYLRPPAPAQPERFTLTVRVTDGEPIACDGVATREPEYA